MNNLYVEFKRNREKEINNFPMGFAFSNKQLEEGMKKLNVTDKSELLSIGAGGFIRKTDKEKFTNLMNKYDTEFKRLIEADKTGEGFIYDMFYYELANHEYLYTLELDDTFDALGLTYDNIKNNIALEKGLKKAIKTQREEI